MSNTEENRGAGVLIEPLDQALPEAKDPVSFFCVSQQIPLFSFFVFLCSFNLFEMVRSHLFASNRKVFLRESPGLADSRIRTQWVKVTET